MYSEVTSLDFFFLFFSDKIVFLLYDYTDYPPCSLQTMNHTRDRNLYQIDRNGGKSPHPLNC